MGDTELPPGEILCPVKSINLLAAQNQASEESIRSQSPKGSGRSGGGSSSTTDQPVIDPTTSETLFRNLKNAKRFAIDIGGSLTKIAYFSTVSHRRIRSRSKSPFPPATPTSPPPPSSSSPTSGDEDLSSSQVSQSGGNEFEYDVWEGARLHFIKFETLFIEECLDFIQKHLAPRVEQEEDGVFSTGKRIKATGGGSYKYSQLIQEKLGLTLEKEDEISCLIQGANFLLKNVPDEAFVFERKQNPEYRFQSAGPVMFPYLLVNIGSGVSILKVEGEDKYQRIGGTATGGGTFWGLGSLLTGGSVTEFDELLSMAEKGDHRNVDMLVRDIYAGDYAKLGLPGDLIASSFGKAVAQGPNDINPNDAIRSLLFTISNDIGQIACLYALQHGLKRIYFGGYFLRNHPLSMYAVSYSIKYWSKGEVEALFLRHEGYLGAIGAFLKGTEELDCEKYSWQENFAGSSSGLIHVDNQRSPTIEIPKFEELIPTAPELHLRHNSLGHKLTRKKSSDILRINVEQLEIDRTERPFGFFPLLCSSSEYFPDCVDLTKEVEARDYWLTCFQGWVERITLIAMESQTDSPTSTDRALRCRQKLKSRLNYLQSNPCAYGLLTVRSLLDTFEQSLREYDFPDPYWNLKQCENAAAVSELQLQLDHLDKLKWKDRQAELIYSFLAGNVFDWGAREVTSLLEGPDQFGFAEARAKVQKRPWLVDRLDEWINRLKDPSKIHKCVAIFVDNSGFDFVLGVLPFVREFLSRGTKVILCSNSCPAVNDMTYPEMVGLLQELSVSQQWLREGLDSGQLKLAGTGQASPCLDLSRVSQDLINLVMLMETDLVIIEGMGRTIHTNLYTKFKCEVIKLAVIKNKWLANRFGGDLFSVSYSEFAQKNF
ncbi:4'-phosphopantetheine phosphatase isoform X4 [Folsomia candida]|uniref:4'-phosphopantetheine phosphatase isoform X4 n=1 Tax=Folsomia candida TaxID=158441 RepID=UPI000B8F5A78|nr:4'-phosphopantetheine phosphatase isoform X4 [Folsomia candida]